jgi:hypothetical protein
MTDGEFDKAVRKMQSDIQEATPYDTGNLATKATKSRSIGTDKFEIYVDEKVAPYFKYVNNRPTLSNGAKNKNYGYFHNAFENALQKMANDAGGVIVRD